MTNDSDFDAGAREATHLTPAVVTGAASGIGRALVALLAAEGATVYAADVAPLGPTTQETGAVAVPADVTVEADMRRLAEVAADARMICLNAGIVGATVGTPWDVPIDEWERVLRVNLLGVVNGLRAFVPELKAAGQPAHILITASLAGLMTFPAGGAYAASKHALIAVAEQTAMALEGSAIGVTVLCPALVRTGMSSEGADPVDVARHALRACNDGTFAVVDEAWTTAITQRSERLAAGEPPSRTACLDRLRVHLAPENDQSADLAKSGRTTAGGAGATRPDVTTRLPSGGAVQ